MSNDQFFKLCSIGPQRSVWQLIPSQVIQFSIPFSRDEGDKVKEVKQEEMVGTKNLKLKRTKKNQNVFFKPLLQNLRGQTEKDAESVSRVFAQNV